MEIRITKTEGIRYTTLALILAALELETAHMRGEFRSDNANALQAEINELRRQIVGDFGGEHKASWFTALVTNVTFVVAPWIRQYHG